MCGYGLAMVGWMVMFGIGLIEVAGNLGFDLPFNDMCGFPNTRVYDALCVLVFGYGLAMVCLMAGFGFGLAS